MALLHVNFFSDVLGMSMNMDVILPQEADEQAEVNHNKGKALKTLYLLHGMSDDHTVWQRRTSIERYVTGLPLAVIMPTTHLGWYTDMRHGLNYWTFISKELPGICRQFFPQLSKKREDTFVAGLSMGGYGALKCGLLAPETFSACASLSGAVDMAGIAEQYNPEDPDLAQPLHVFYNAFGPFESMKGSDNDLLAVAERLIEKAKRPRVYMWCGTEDFLIEPNRKMRDHLTKLGYALTYEEAPGDHQWKYWDDRVQRVLEWLDIPASPLAFR